MKQSYTTPECRLLPLALQDILTSSNLQAKKTGLGDCRDCNDW